MKRSARIMTMILALLITAAAAAGCSNANLGKQQLLDALAKQQQITRHAFNGKLDLNLASLPAPATNQPYTSIILQALKQGEIAWSGNSDTAEQRQEAELRFTTSDGSTQFMMPVIQAEDTVYVHIPVINLEDEYFSLPASAQTVNLGGAALSSLTRFVEAMDENWFSASKTDDGALTIRMTITEKDWTPFLLKVNEAFPNMVEEWQMAGMISEQQAADAKTQWEQFAADNADRIHMAENREAYLIATVNPDGYVSSLEADIGLEITPPTGNSETHSIRILHEWSRINEQPEFTRDIPETIVSYDELLKLIP